MDIMTRTFFSVGNGGFCLRHFESGENVIYDCRATKASSDLDLADDFFIEDLILNPERTIHEYDEETKIACIRLTQDVPPPDARQVSS